MKKFLQNFAKFAKSLFDGFCIGLANMVAGLSGGTIAIIRDVYDDMLDLYSNLITHLFKAVKKHWRLILGIVIGVVVGTLTISKAWKYVPLPVTGFFAGMVLFSLIPAFKNLKIFTKKGNLAKGQCVLKNIMHFFVLIVMFGLMVALPFINGKPQALQLNTKSVFISIGLGLISSIAMVLPGVSGSLLMAAFGYYDDFTEIGNELLHFQNLTENITLGFSFGVGCLIGLVLSAIAIKKLVKKYDVIMNFLIYGLIAGSLVSMFFVGIDDQVTANARNNYSQVARIIICCVSAILLILGIFAGYFMDKKEAERKKGSRSNNSDINKIEDNDMSNKEYSMNDFLSLSEKYFAQYKKDLKELVKIPSVLDEYNEGSNEPFGKANREALEFMLALGKRDGFKTYNCDNYAGDISFGDGIESLGLLAHLDVVPVSGQKWDHDPFDMVEKDGKLIGRGVNDDKGPLLASYYAIKILSDLGFKPNKEIKLIMGCDEESGSRCLEHYFKYNKMPSMGFSPDACFPCINGEKGHAHIDVVGKTEDNCLIESFVSGERYNIVPEEAHMTLTKNFSKEYEAFLEKNNYKGEYKDGTYYAYGTAAHAMSPEKGFNATFILFEFINEVCPCDISRFMTKYVTFDPFGLKLGLDKTYDELGRLTLNVGVVRINERHIKVGFDLRVPADEMEQLIRDNFYKACSEFDGLTFDMPAMTKVHYVSKDSFLVKALVKSYQEATGDYSHGAYSIGGGTYAKFMDSAVAFGPQFIGREDVDHQANEYIYESDYKKIIAIYAKSIYDLTK